MPTQHPLTTAAGQCHAKVGQHLSVAPENPQPNDQRAQANYKIDS